MHYKPSIEELQNYLQIHRASELKDQKFAYEILGEKTIFDEQNPEHQFAAGSFANYIRKKFNLSPETSISLSEQTLTGISFFTADLSDLDLSSAIFNECSFSSTVLQRTKLDSAKFQGCNFSSDLVGIESNPRISIDEECIISLNDESLQQKLEAIQSPSTQERSVF